MSDNPTNGELAVMMKSIVLSVDKMEKHLEKQNDKVFKNTAFRLKWSGAYILFGICGIAIGLLSTIKNIWG